MLPISDKDVALTSVVIAALLLVASMAVILGVGK